MVWSGFSYNKRQFAKLPQGFINSTDARIIDTGYIDELESVLYEQGIGVMQTGVIGDVVKVKRPDSTIVTNTSFMGILVHEHAKYRIPGQALLTYRGTELAPICRQARNIRVWADTAVTTGGRVYLIHTPATGETPGHFKATMGANSVQIPAKWLETTTAPGIASLELEAGNQRIVA